MEVTVVLGEIDLQKVMSVPLETGKSGTYLKRFIGLGSAQESAFVVSATSVSSER